MRERDPSRGGYRAPSTTRLEFVQALRGIAALLVVLWHASIYLGPYGTGIGGRLFGPGASMGVDLFFLVSGFIMVHTTRASDGSWKSAAAFAIKRVSRIWPLWIVALALCVLCRADAEAFAYDPAKRAWLLHSLLFIPTAGAPSDVAPIYGFPVLGVGWTLNYEMYFYAIFGASMLFARWRWVAFFAWIATTLLLLPYCAGHLATAADWAGLAGSGNAHRFGLHYLDLMTHPLVLMFVAGVVIGMLHGSRHAIEDARVLRILCLVVTACVVLQYATQWRVGHGIAHWGLSLAPLLLVYSMASRRIVMPVPRWLVGLGNMSFSLYLLHPLVLGILPKAAVRFDHVPRSGPAAIFLMTTLSIALAALSYAVIERGPCEWLKHWLLRRLFARRGAMHAVAG
ncbi:MAG TPA: acyltransferase [Dokdonella sp.]|nr:acyltransferase [Dokdonella sp.]